MSETEQKFTGNYKGRDHYYREDYDGNYYENFRGMYQQKCNNGPRGCIYSNPGSYGTGYTPTCTDYYPFPPGYPLRAEYYQPPPVKKPDCGYYSSLTNYGCAFGPKYSNKCCERRATCSLVGVI